MTTPERLRSRQRIQTLLVVVTILLATLSVWYNDQQDDRQDDCLKELLGARGDLQARAQAADEKFLLSVPTLETRKDFDKAFKVYAETQAQVRKERARVPIRGACE